MEPIKYLVIDGMIVEEGTEADLVNKAAAYDTDYAILEQDELHAGMLEDWVAVREQERAEATAGPDIVELEDMPEFGEDETLM